MNYKYKYPINEGTIIELKGEFRSNGNSSIYFGLQCFTEDDKEIKAEEVNRLKEFLLITSFDCNGKSLTLNRKPETWNNKNDDYSEKNKKYIGLYFDGNFNHLPDYIIRTPAYKNYETNVINLQNEIPKDILDKIIPYTTKVMNHYDSMRYDYSAACQTIVPEKWTVYNACYNGFSDGYGDIKGKFRLETKKVSPFVICQNVQNNEGLLEVKNIEIKVIEKINFI